MNTKILVIDDDPDLLKLMTHAFTRSGFEVFGAKDGGVGARLCREHRPHLVVTDILMPKREGIEIIVEMKRGPEPPKVIAISGGGQLASLDFLELALALGADQVLRKPFRMSALVALAWYTLGEEALMASPRAPPAGAGSGPHA